MGHLHGQTQLPGLRNQEVSFLGVELRPEEGGDGERRFSTEPSGAAGLFTLQTKATTRDASADPTPAETPHTRLRSAPSGPLDSPGPPARCLSGERGPEGEPGPLPLVTWPGHKQPISIQKALPRSGLETTWTDRISGPDGRSWCRRCTRPPCTAAPLQSVTNKAARRLKKSPKHQSWTHQVRITAQEDQDHSEPGVSISISSTRTQFDGFQGSRERLDGVQEVFL